MPERTIRIQLEFNRGQLRLLLAAALVCAQAADLASESLTLTTTYPSPAGIYNQVVTTGNAGAAPMDTTLNRNAGNTVLVPPSNAMGNAGVGTSAPGAKLEVALGDVYISTPGRGLIVRSPNGAQCQRILVSNDGNLSTDAASCP
ncbi:MAG: hypothetical protein HY077_18845 [Elusimicrobia bacterium]|nr:hypothetical protein [Elusimicrobiota bacterium]